jgi:hypothetical protein
VPFTRSILHAAPRGGVGQLVGDPPGPSGGAHRVARTPRSASRGDWCAHDGQCVRSINAPKPSRAERTSQVGRFARDPNWVATTNVGSPRSTVTTAP